MWQINEKKHSNPLLDQVHIQGDSLSCRVYPNLGASVQELTIGGQAIIDGIRPDEKGLMEYRQTYKSSVLFPFPNRIQDGTYEFADQVYELECNEAEHGNAIHGLVYDKAFQLIAREARGQKAVLGFKYTPEEELEGFPFRFELEIWYTLEEPCKFSMEFLVRNTDTRPFPFGLGWHPYFKATDLRQSVLIFPSKEFFPCNERYIPQDRVASDLKESFEVDEEVFDDAFSLHEARCSLRDVSYGVEMEFDTGDGAYLQVYTPDHRKNIAVEPMTCVANAFNNNEGLRVLKAGETFQWMVRMQMSKGNAQ